MANAPAATAQVAGQSWPSAVPPPGALAANEVRGRVIWLNPSITRSRHLGGLRRRRTQSAAEVQGNSLKLSRAKPTFAIGRQATARISTPPSRQLLVGQEPAPRRLSWIWPGWSLSIPAVWPRWRAGGRLARHAGGDLLLAAPQHQMLRVLTLTRLIDVFPVYASADEAARTAGLTRQAAAPVDGSPARVAMT
jgi:hypothetical protein